MTEQTPAGQALFPLGRTVATPGALAALEAARLLPFSLLARHNAGDWGDICEEDKRENARALKRGSRLFSAYNIGEGVRVWVITESDRSATTLLLPAEY